MKLSHHLHVGVPASIPSRAELLIRTIAQGGRGSRVGKSLRDRTIDGSTPTAGDFEFGTLAIPLTLLCVFRMRH